MRVKRHVALFLDNILRLLWKYSPSNYTALDVTYTVTTLADTMSYRVEWALNDTTYTGALPLVTVHRNFVIPYIIHKTVFEFQHKQAWSAVEPSFILKTDLDFGEYTHSGSEVEITMPKCSETRSVDLCGQVGCVLCPLLECVDASNECAIMPAPVVRADPAAHSAVLSWNAVIGLDYRISNDTDIIVNVTSTDGSKYVVSGLEPFTTYTIYVISVKGSFESAQATVTFTTLAVPSEPPTGLVVSKVEHDAITLSWTASLSPSVTEYWIESTSLALRYVEVTVGTTVVIDAQPDTTFTVKVFSYNGQLFSLTAAETTVSTPLPPIPKPYSAVVKGTTDTEVEFSVLNPETYIIVFNVTEVASGNCSECSTFTVDAIISVSSLTPLTEYAITAMYCRDPSDCSPVSDATVFTTLQSPPTQPTNITVDATTDTIVVLSWLPSEYCDYYTVSLVSSDSTYAEYYFTPETTATFRGISADTILTFSVSASSTIGTSTASSKSVSTKKTAPSIKSLVASDPDNLDRVFSVGDLITVSFDISTNTPACFELVCSVNLDAVTFTSKWTNTVTNVLTVTQITSQPSPLLSLTTCRPSLDCPVLRADSNSPPSASSAVITGTWGEQPTEMSIVLPSSVTIDEDTTHQFFPTITSDRPIPVESVATLVVSVTGNGHVSAAGQPWASNVKIVDNYDVIQGVLAFGITIQPDTHSTDSFRLEVSLTVAGLEDVAMTNVGINPTPDAFEVSFPTEAPQVNANGGAFLGGITITDSDETGSYNLIAQVGTSAVLTLEPAECPAGIVMVSQIIAIISGSKSHIECALSKLHLAPHDDAVASGSVTVEVSLVDLDARNAGLAGAQTSADILVDVSCVGLDGGVLTSAAIDTDMTIELQFSRAVSVDFVFAEAKAVFDAATVALLGSGAYVLSGSDSFRVYPGPGATFVVSSPITILDNVFYTCPEESFSTGTVTLLPPSTVFSPEVSILGPSNLPVCNTGIELWASAGGMGGRPAVFTFTVDDALVFTKAVTTDDGVLTLPSDALLPGTTYIFTATVTNLFGKTAMASHSVTVADHNVPQVTVSPDSGAFLPNTIVPLTASVIASECLPEDMRRIVYSWSASPEGLITGPSDQYATTIDTSAIGPLGQGTVTLTVTMASMAELSVTQQMVFDRKPLAPVADIAGGSQRSPRQSSAITMDASGSAMGDGELTFSWSCLSLLTMLPCTDRLGSPLTMPNEEMFDIPSASLALGAYAFTVKVTDATNSLADSDSQLVIPKQGDVPEISIEQTATVVNANDEISFRASVKSDYPDALLAFHWTSEDVDLSELTSDVRAPLLTLSSSTFTAGQVISVSCRVTDPVGLAASAVTKFDVNSAPYAGDIHMSTDSVEAMTGVVTLTTFNWEDRQGGVLTYQWMIMDLANPVILSPVSLKKQVTVSVPKPADGKTSVTVAVVVRDSMGATAFATKQLTVTSPLEGVSESSAFDALAVAKKNLVDTGSPDLTVSLVSTVITSDLTSTRRMSSSLASELTDTLTNIADIAGSTTSIDLITKLALKIDTFNADVSQLLTLLQKALTVLRQDSTTSVDRNEALAASLQMAVKTLSKPSLRRDTVNDPENIIEVLRAILNDITTNTLKLQGQTYSAVEDAQTVYATRVATTSGLPTTAISDHVSVSAVSAGTTFESTFDMHVMVFPARLSAAELNFVPPVAATPLPIGSVDISAVSASTSPFMAEIAVTFTPVSVNVSSCEYCEPTCVVLSSSGKLLFSLIRCPYTI